MSDVLIRIQCSLTICAAIDAKAGQLKVTRSALVEILAKAGLSGL